MALYLRKNNVLKRFSGYVASTLASLCEMIGYTKPVSTSAISANDSVSDAIGKLEVKADQALGVWTTPVSAAVGDTTVTITDANIHTTSKIFFMSDNQTSSSDNIPIVRESVNVTEGTCVITFPALEKATVFTLWVIN